MSKQVNLHFEEEIYGLLKECSEKYDISVQGVVREAVLHMLSNKKGATGKAFTFIDLFAGIGGMRLAFEANGGECVFTSEWDKYCQKTYYENFGEMPVGDIRQVDEKEVPDHDILVAGFPCQPFSIAGVSKKNSLGRDHGFKDKTQGTLFFDVVRILDEKRPKAFLLENVKNLKSHDKGRTWAIIMKTLDELDYEVFPYVLDGQGFVPQHRERVYIVGFDRQKFGQKIDFDCKLNKPEKKPVLNDILEREVDTKYTLSDKLWNYLQEYSRKHKEKGNGFGFGLPDRYGVTRTLSARYYKDGSEILIYQEGKNPRRLTPRECARLQGYPEDFKITVSDTQAYKQFGNSIVVPLVAEIAGNMIEFMENPEGRDGNVQLKFDYFGGSIVRRQRLQAGQTAHTSR